MKKRRALTAIAAALATLAACASRAPSILLVAAPSPREDAPPGAAWSGAARGTAAFEVRGLGPDALQALAADPPDPERWRRIFAVRVESAAANERAEQTELPPMLGDYAVDRGVIRFVPRFPLQDGVTYRAVLDVGRLRGDADARTGAVVTRSFAVPAATPTPSASVARVFPSGDELPENLLKFYVHFSAPMSQGGAYDHVHLLDASAAGREVELPFLELGEELWDPTGTRFTLFFDPGRIKRGLLPREQVGPALVEGGTYTLVVDREWPDARGAPMRDAFRKTFRVTAPDEIRPDPGAWRLHAPEARTRDPLIVDFPDAMDHALLQRMLWVVDALGNDVAGTVAVVDREKRWSLTPAAPWPRGEFALVADTALEDLAGNNIEALFDVDTFGTGAGRLDAATVRVPFEVTDPR